MEKSKIQHSAHKSREEDPAEEEVEHMELDPAPAATPIPAVELQVPAGCEGEVEDEVVDMELDPPPMNTPSAYVAPACPAAPAGASKEPEVEEAEVIPSIKHPPRKHVSYRTRTTTEWEVLITGKDNAMSTCIERARSL